jgi:hypothetical protein
MVKIVKINYINITTSDLILIFNLLNSFYKEELNDSKFIKKQINISKNMMI